VSTLARVVFLALVAATFGAFFVAQRLKGAPPVVELKGVRWFSPNGDGRKDVSDFTLRLRESDVLTADLIDAAGAPVRRLVSARRVAPSELLRLRWDGRTDAGSVAPDGPYRVRARLAGQGRSVTVPKLITLDTKPPRPRVVCIAPARLAGGCSEPLQVVGPRTPAMAVHVRGISQRRATLYRVLRTDVRPPARPSLVAKGRRAPGLKRWIWNGRSGGRPVPPGVYLVQVGVRDRAGNLGRTPAQVPPPPGDSPGPAGITVRSLAAQPPLRPVSAGGRAEFFVDARGRAYRWALRRSGARRPVRRGRARPGRARPLVVRAPRGRSGLYLLELRSGRARTRVPFVVQARERADLLVVVPAITWLGAGLVDDPPLRDGIPDTLERSGGGRVRWPRVFAGLPAGLRGQVAPLLLFLDHARVRYDLTSDLDLALSTAPRSSDRKGVLLAGSERWVTRGLARRLRRYALDGGRVAVFGTETLRRGVTLRANGAETAGELLRPTQPTAQDPFGATLAPIRRTDDGPAAISQLAGDPGYGLFTGSDGTLDGFSAFEESPPPGPGSRAEILAALGRPPPEPDPEAPADTPPPEERHALTASRLGEKGLVIRVGLPEWPQRLRDPEIAQVTRNIVDLLRGRTPRFRSAR
jgi:hypothetical protein